MFHSTNVIIKIWIYIHRFYSLHLEFESSTVFYGLRSVNTVQSIGVLQKCKISLHFDFHKKGLFYALFCTVFVSSGIFYIILRTAMAFRSSSTDAPCREAGK